MRYISLAVTLFAFWLLLSGHYTAMLLVIGLLCCLGITLLALRMDIVDAEGHPIGMLWRAGSYWAWLVSEIIRSAWQVSKIILSPVMPVSPTLTRVKASQKSRVGVATYANSITLTPGTISVEVDGNDIVVHALVAEGADGVESGEMDRKVTRFEGRG